MAPCLFSSQVPLAFFSDGIEIGGSTPGISQARMAARGLAGRIKPFDNMSLQPLILPRSEEY